MTCSQLRRMEEMWRAGVPVKLIARAVHLSAWHVYHVASLDRERFPRRHAECGMTDPVERRKWAQRVASGECSLSEAARTCGVSRKSLRRWARAL